MMECKDCIHYQVCQYHITEETKMTVAECSNFRDKSKFIELPDKFYSPYNFLGETGMYEYDVIDYDILFTVKSGNCTYEGCSKDTLQEYGFYTTKQEAEKALKERESK